MVKLFVGQGSRNMAHNLDETYERWEHRIIAHEEHKNEGIPFMPALSSYLEAKAYSKFLHDKAHTFRKQANKHEVGSPVYNDLMHKVDRIKVMQSSVVQQMHGAKWYYGRDPYQEACKLIELGLLRVAFNKDEMANEVFNAQGDLIYSVPLNDIRIAQSNLKVS